jgi:hypothetical protein
MLRERPVSVVINGEAYVTWRTGTTNRVGPPNYIAGGIVSLESIPRLLKRLQILAQTPWQKQLLQLRSL